MKLQLMSLLLGSILLVGCTNSKLQNIHLDRPVYESSYQLKDNNVVGLKQLVRELEELGIELRDIPSDHGDSPSRYEGFYFDLGEFDMSIYARNEEQVDDKLLNSIFITTGKDKSLWDQPAIKSISKLIGDENIVTWLKEQEEQNQEFVKDIMGVGQNNIVYSLNQDSDYKSLYFNWSLSQELTKALEGIVAELENQGFFMKDYMKNSDGEMVNMTTPYYYLSEDYRFYYNDREEIERVSGDAISYKVMYNPAKHAPYSVQIYGLIPERASKIVKIQDMIGMDMVSRMMDMSLEDFNNMTNAINEELTKVRDSFASEAAQEYNAKGQIGSYNYEIYMSNGSNGMVHRFTVLLEGI